MYKKAGSGKVTKIATTTKRTYTDKSVKNGVVYRYYIQALGKGNYKSSAKSGASITTYLTAPANLKVTAGKKQATVYWKKNTKATGYQIRYSLKSSMASSKTVSIAKVATAKRVIKNLKKGIKYYFQIRAYKKVSGKTYYSVWSVKKSTKVK